MKILSNVSGHRPVCLGTLAAVALLGASPSALAADTWVGGMPRVWARDEGTAACAPAGGEGAYLVTHSGTRDWSVNPVEHIATKPFERFRIVCDIASPDGAQTLRNSVHASCILQNSEGRVMDWMHGERSVSAPGRLATEFVVPFGGAFVEPRLTGDGPNGFRYAGFTVERLEPIRSEQAGLPEAWTAGTAELELSVSSTTGSATVKDLRTGRTWTPSPAPTPLMVTDGRAGPDGRSVELWLFDASSLRTYRATYALAERGAELSVTLDGEGEMEGRLHFPAAFDSAPGDRAIVPLNEGIGVPVDEPHPGVGWLPGYGGHGLCMSFFGMQEDVTGAGWMCLVETPDDMMLDLADTGTGGRAVAGAMWLPQKGAFGYARRLRYVFLDRGGYVAMAKRYREHAKEKGLFRPFSEKVKANPNIDLLLGAANIWVFGRTGNGPAALVREMQSLGMDRILWSGGGSPEDVGALRALPNVLVGRYDIYQDLMDPAQYGKIAYTHPDWTTEEFPEGIMWSGPDPSQWTHGWAIERKDGGEGMIPCAVLCDTRAPAYARRRIAADLGTRAYTARFIDTTTASPWRECWNPAHPMTRTESREWKMRLLEVVGKDFGLVCGSETWHDAAVPFCDYFEGMLSLGPYRVPDSGRHMQRVWDEVPENLAKYQTGEKYRLPLWELVYHDCVVAQWYWGDYNNKLPKVWRRRDLFNALYGTPPMYLFNASDWDELREKVAESYRIAEPVSRATAYAEMLTHEALTPDRCVQRTRFSNGVTVTVNFGPVPFEDRGGTIAPEGLRIDRK